MPNIHHALLIPAPAEKVYNAITSDEGLSAWWSPGSTAKPEVGSVAHIPFGTEYSKEQYFKEMKITELKHFELVKWNCIAGVDQWIGTNLSFKLESVDKTIVLNSYPEIGGQLQRQRDFDKGTLLIFHHDDWREYTLMFAECSYTWGQFLRSLKLLCETGKGKPWPNQHSTEL